MKKTAGEKTKEKILNAGLKLWPNITLQSIADKTDMTHAAVLYHFPAGTLEYKIAEYAIEKGNSAVIVQLIATKHPAAKKLTAAQRIKHFNAIH